MFNFEVCAYLVKIKEAKFFFASFVYPVAPEDGTGASSPVSLLRETFMVPVYPG